MGGISTRPRPLRLLFSRLFCTLVQQFPPTLQKLRRPPALEEKLHAWTKYHFKPQADHRCEVCTSLRVRCFCWLLREPANLQPVALRLRHPHVRPSVSRLHYRSTTNCRYVFHTNLWFTRATTCITCTRSFIFHQQRRFVNYCLLYHCCVGKSSFVRCRAHNRLLFGSSDRYDYTL